MRLLLIVFLLVPMTSMAAPLPPADAEKVVRAFVEKAKADQGEIKLVTDAALGRVLPNITVFSLRFRQWPVAIEPPQGYGSSNLLIVNDRGEVTRFNHDKGFLPLLTKVTAREENAAQEVAQALLVLESELLQDGFYKFQPVPEEQRTMKDGNRLHVFARLMVTEGGNGNVNVALTFEADGSLKSTSFMNTVKPGPRPRCQATLLLHPDPQVRAVCEQNLLFIGRAAQDYLREQRARATPELQREIDRVWQRIEAAGR